MVDVAAGAGAEASVDETGIDVDATARLALSIGSLADKIQRQLDEAEARERRLARLLPVGAPTGRGVAAGAGVGRRVHLGRQARTRPPVRGPILGRRRPDMDSHAGRIR